MRATDLRGVPALAILLLAAAGVAAGEEPAGPVEEQTVAALQSIARDPTARTAVPVGGFDLVARHKEEFEAAFQKARGALAENRGNPDLRANLGVLYYLRDTVRGEDLGGLSRSLDQFLGTLALDPENAAALGTLASPRVLRTFRARLSGTELEALESGLARAAGYGSVAAEHVWTRLLLGDPSRAAEARAHAKALTEKDPRGAASWIEFGAASLRGGDNAEDDPGADAAILDAFKKALRLDPTPPERTAALLGVAAGTLRMLEIPIGPETYAIGDDKAALASIERSMAEPPEPEKTRQAVQAAQAAADALLQARALPKGDLEDAAYFGLDLDDLRLSLGKTLNLLDDPGDAVSLMGIEVFEYVNTRRALRFNNAAYALYQDRRYDLAFQIQRRAVALCPTNAVQVRNLAFTAFDAGFYRESIQAFERLPALGETLSAADSNTLGLACAVLGDYEHASEVLDRAVKAFPGDEPNRQWLTVLSQAAGKLDAARRHENSTLIRCGLQDLGERAEKAGARYAALEYYTQVYHLLGVEARARSFGREEEKRWTHEERLKMRDRIVRIYGLLPVKPRVPAGARRLFARGQAHADAGHLLWAEENFHLAVDLAPWWPAAVYNLAQAAWAEGARRPGAIEEMKTYLQLAPGGAHDAEIRQMLAGWERELQADLQAGEKAVAFNYGDQGDNLDVFENNRILIRNDGRMGRSYTLAQEEEERRKGEPEP